MKIVMKVKEIDGKTIIITGNTDDEYKAVIKEVVNGINKVAPDCGVTVKIMLGYDKE